MRLGWIATATILVAGPASADMTARYVAEAGSAVAPGLTIEVNDRGDSRIVTHSGDAILIIAETTYLVGRDAEGSFAFRWTDMMDLMAQLRAGTAATSPPPPPPPPAPHFVAVARTQETVAGRAGRVWAIRQQGHEGEPGLDIVISDDLALAPIGRALAAYLLQVIESAPHFGARDAPPLDVTRAVLQRGSLLRLGELLRLEGVESHPIPRSEFQLAIEPLARDAIMARVLAHRIDRESPTGEGHGPIPVPIPR